jgi:putative inorganic carbon (HCO3(-)) transporter
MARHLLQDLRYRVSKRVSDLTARTFFKEKLNNWLGYICVALLACLFGTLESNDLISGIALFAILVSVLLITVFFTNPEFCFYFYLIFGFWIYFFNSFLFHGLFPVGTLYDALAICCLLGLMFTQFNFRDRLQHFGKIPLVQYFVVLLFYYIMEMFNPNSGGPSATAFTGFRKFIDFIIILLAAYMLIDSMAKIRKFSRILLIAAGISALYGCIQQWHGIFPWDMEQIMADQNSYNLLFVNGELRKFGTMADPTEYGLMMTACALYFFVISLSEKDKTWRNIYFVNIILMVLSLGYSGTRTAYASLIAGLGFFILLNIEKRPIRVAGPRRHRDLPLPDVRAHLQHRPDQTLPHHLHRLQRPVV